MPNDALAGWMEALKFNEAKRAQAVAERLAQQQADERAKHDEEQLQETRDFHKAQTEREKAVLKATEALHHLQSLKEFQGIGLNISKGAPVPAGLTAAPGNEPGFQTISDPSMLQDQPAPGFLMNLPQPVSMQVQNPREFAQQQAANQEIANQPAIDKANAIETQRAADALAKQRELLNAQDARAAALQRELNDRQARHDVVLENIAAGHDAARDRANRSASAPFVSNLPGETLKNYFDQAFKGEKTLGDFKKIIPLKEQGAFFSEATNAGIGFMDDKQRAMLGAFRPAFAAIDKANELNALLTGDRLLGLKPNTVAGQRAKSLKRQINENLVSAAQALGQQRLSDPRVKAMTDAFEQSLNPFLGSVENNQKTSRDLEEYILDTLSDKLSNLPPEQRDYQVKALQASARPQKMVKVQAPNGEMRQVPAKDVEFYKQRGAKVMP